MKWNYRRKNTHMDLVIEAPDADIYLGRTAVENEKIITFGVDKLAGRSKPPYSAMIALDEAGKNRETQLDIDEHDMLASHAASVLSAEGLPEDRAADLEQVVAYLLHR